MAEIDEIGGLFENQHHFLTTRTWNALIVNANRTKLLHKQYREMLESRISVAATEKCQGGKPHAKTVAWSYDTEGRAKTCFEMYYELANKKTKQQYKVSTPCLDDHHFKKKELESVGELSKVCSQIVLKNACIWHELDDLTFCGQ